ncbi:MAG: CTP synthase, partial [Deltaproteobacteria bacterium]|nr:CTP synthase [Deltaproteobacteria bacterium]
PTQHSVKALREIGIQPDILLCRTENFLSEEIKAKIALFCNVEVAAVFTAKDVECIYEVPLVFHHEGLDEKIVELLNIWTGRPHLKAWEDVVEKFCSPSAGEVSIAIVGKYVNLTDSYKSLNEALMHAGIANDCRVNLRFVDSEGIEKEGCGALLAGADGILVPGGFGARGIDGMICAIEQAREQNIPFFGICLGMQMAVVEYARHVVLLDKANSSEFDEKTPYPVIDLLPEQKTITEKGASMRLGAFPCVLEQDSLAYEAYQALDIAERHRHRYEFNNDFKDAMMAGGLRFSGSSPNGSLAEIVEIKNHPWFLGCQFHPEFKSRPTNPHPLFTSFIRAAMQYKLRKK